MLAKAGICKSHENNSYLNLDGDKTMGMVSTNEFKPGLKIILDGDPYAIVENEFVKPGKGQAFSRVKIRNLKTARVIDKTFKSGETVQAADVIDVEMQYLYNDGNVWNFMDSKSFEQYEIPTQIVGDSAKWLQEQSLCMVTLWNGIPLSVIPPNFIISRIVTTDPGLKGDTSGGGGKPATIDTGAVIKVPLFVQIDELIKVDTRTGDYVSRVKE